MRVPIRKPGKYTHQKKDPFVTKQKFDEMNANLEKMKTKIRPPLIKEVKRLALDGDFSENVPYSIAKGKLRGLNQRILDIEEFLKTAQVINTDSNNLSVQIGNTVVLQKGNIKRTYQILGSSETNPISGIISHMSPLGQALIDKKIGDEIIVKGKNESNSYKLLEIK